MIKKNHALKVLTIIVSVLFIGYFIEPYRQGSTLVGDYFEISTELLPLVMSFSIFVMTWFAYRKSWDDHSFFLGGAFFVIGLLELFHILSQPFMPDFITPNSLNKAATFRIGIWLISALFFLGSTHVYKDSLPGLINKYVMFAFAIVVSIISLTTVLFYTDYLPQMYYPDGSLSNTFIYLALIPLLILLYTSYIYTIRLAKTGEKNIICLIYGFIILLFSIPVYFFYDYSGHLLKAAGFYFIYLALFKSSIEQPYGKLADAEHKLRYVAEMNYRNLFDNANDAIIITDLEDRITSWNRSAEKIFGWGAHEATGKNLAQLIVPSHLHAEREKIINNILSGMEVTGYDTVRLRKDGNAIDVSMTISPMRNSEQNIIGLSSIIRDITERKHAEQALQESEDRYRRLVELSPDGIAIHSEGKIIFINAAGARLLGAADPEQLIGKPIIDFVHPDHRGVAQERIRQIIEEGKIAPMIEEKFIQIDGNVITVEEVAMPFTYQGKPAVQIVTSDITERKQAEEQIRSSLAEKEVLLREIHHRVKNNMQIISSLLSLQSEFNKDKNVIEMFKDSRNRITSMALIHEKLYQSENFTKIDLRGYVTDLVNGLFHSYGVNIDKVALNINVEDVSLGIDAAIPCGLIINELVTNSLKYAFPGDRKGELKIILRSADQNLIELVVNDNGIGIPKELDLRNVKSLGLHLVTILAENQLQGEINLNRNNGAEFQIKFRGVK